MTVCYCVVCYVRRRPRRRDARAAREFMLKIMLRAGGDVRESPKIFQVAARKSRQERQNQIGWRVRMRDDRDAHGCLLGPFWVAANGGNRLDAKSSRRQRFQHLRRREKRIVERGVDDGRGRIGEERARYLRG